MYVIKDEWDHFEEKYADTTQIFLSKRTVLDPVQLVRMHIRPGQKVPNPTGSGSTTLQNDANVEMKNICKKYVYFFLCKTRLILNAFASGRSEPN
jgi:hypothetical protein